jgi:FhaA, N-terminal domain/FHA domain
MGLRGVERRLERMVEGVFSRAFRSGLRPVELGRRITRVMDEHRTVGVAGTTVVPNHFTVHISPDDAEQLGGVVHSLGRELADVAREHARDEGYAFMGPVRVDLVADGTQGAGRFDIEADLREQIGGKGAGSLVLSTGDRLELGAEPFQVGRLGECGLTLPDPNVSRRHAELRPVDGAWVIADLGSMNGTRVNGRQITEQRLVDGDVISVGHHSFRFEAS